jgi:hypothetical protein
MFELSLLYRPFNMFSFSCRFVFQTTTQELTAWKSSPAPQLMIGRKIPVKIRPKNVLW